MLAGIVEDALQKEAEKLGPKPVPILGTDGIVILAMSDKDKTKNNLIWRGEVYHAWCIDAGNFTAYSRVTVVGYDKSLKWIKLIAQIATVVV